MIAERKNVVKVIGPDIKRSVSYHGESDLALAWGNNSRIFGSAAVSATVLTWIAVSRLPNIDSQYDLNSITNAEGNNTAVVSKPATISFRTAYAGSNLLSSDLATISDHSSVSSFQNSKPIQFNESVNPGILSTASLKVDQKTSSSLTSQIVLVSPLIAPEETKTDTLIVAESKYQQTMVNVVSSPQTVLTQDKQAVVDIALTPQEDSKKIEEAAPIKVIPPINNDGKKVESQTSQITTKIKISQNIPTQVSKPTELKADVIILAKPALKTQTVTPTPTTQPAAKESKIDSISALAKKIATKVVTVLPKKTATPTPETSSNKITISGLFGEKVPVDVICGTYQIPQNNCGHGNKNYNYAAVCRPQYYRCINGDYTSRLKLAVDIIPLVPTMQKNIAVRLPKINGKDYEYNLLGPAIEIGPRGKDGIPIWGYRYIAITKEKINNKYWVFDFGHVNKAITGTTKSGEIKFTLFTFRDGSRMHLHFDGGESDTADPTYDLPDLLNTVQFDEPTTLGIPLTNRVKK